MKLSNLFNKTKKNNTSASVQKLEKNQLSKVIGGADKGINEAAPQGPAPQKEKGIKK